jgi:YD repeat-containing protein
MIRSIHLLLAFLALFAGNANLFAAAGRRMSFSYDSLGHLTQLVSTEGQITP